MCTSAICQAALASLSRRDILALAAAGIASGALIAQGQAATPKTPSRRFIPGSIPAGRVTDLTHILSGDFPYIPIPGLTFPFKLGITSISACPAMKCDGASICVPLCSINSHLLA